MMTLLHLLSYVGGLAGFLFVTLSLASGLLWLAELIEEHTKYAKVIGIRAIYVIIVLHIILVITDGLPILPTLFSITAHLVYLTNFSSAWPFISLTSLKFIASCILVVSDHFIWFFHFAARAQESKKYSRSSYRNYGGQSGRSGLKDSPAFMDVAAFFAICVWAIPLFLFLSLSANDNALPSSFPSQPASPAVGAIDLNSPGPSTTAFAKQVASRYGPTSTGHRTSLLKIALDPVFALLPRIRRSRNNKRDDEGLLAPRTPIRGSPLHTPVGMPSSGYFPWTDGDSSTGGGSSGSASASTSGYGNLGVDSARQRPGSPGNGNGLGLRKNGAGSGSYPHPPGPPRRVQSEAVTVGINPRGIATRNGKPAVSDSALGGGADDPEDMRLGDTGTGFTSKVSLGPRGNVPVGPGEILDSKRKTD